LCQKLFLLTYGFSLIVTLTQENFAQASLANRHHPCSLISGRNGVPLQNDSRRSSMSSPMNMMASVVEIAK